MVERAIFGGVIIGNERAECTRQIAGNEFGLSTYSNSCNDCCPQIPDTLYVTFAGLAGDFAVYNGKHTLIFQIGHFCRWNMTWGPNTFITLVWQPGYPIPVWAVGLNLPGDCDKWWEGGADGCDPTDPYIDNGGQFPWYCRDGGCGDGDSCEKSVGATCVVSTS